MPEAEKIPHRLGRLIASPKVYAKQKSLLAGLRWLRANLPLGRVEAEDFDTFWVVTKHADISEIIRQHDLFHNGDRAHTLVPRGVLAISPTAIRDIRAIEPRLWRVVPEIAERAVPGVECRLADFLCAPGTKGS
jgi:cytochrome P450